MSRWFDFSNDEYQFHELGALRAKWRKVPSHDAVNAIAEAHQYYDFLKTMIVGRVQSWSHPVDDRESWFKPTPLVLSARSGAISSCISVGSSIIECAMRAHAENRKLRELMKNKPEHRTFGKVIYAWKKHGVYSSEIATVIDDIEKIHGRRNDIHLYASFGRSWEDVVNEETDILAAIEKLFDFFQGLDPA
ncbi:hypothetical protein [Marinobacterium iners]|uniref:Uncharacterized protein n=1 Tax=Marinobacterium iners DSM 11526 TaxID=1122198 RepID=A0A1H4HAE0_9GAMM|nr:hypothetical protein [Marinobacterium iners]SEB18655.1 hypothetical protein SAMN02745729_1363 [Marinobacterium iners DSM 11526]